MEPVVFHKSGAQPFLAFESSYLRLEIRGGHHVWEVGPLQDLRECSHHQIHEKIEEEDWYINVFGTDLQGVPSPSTPMTRPRKIPEERGIAPSTPGAQPGTPGAQPSTPRTALKPPAVLALPDQSQDDDNLLQASAYEPAERAIVPQQPAEIEEFEARPHRDLAPLRPNYNLRRVMQRIPKLVEQNENEKAKQLLLGLHERLWHSPASDFINLLRRAGMSGEVIALAREAVQSCAICRKYVRLPNRPQLRARGANTFNQTLQMDLFFWDGKGFMILVDEATRFKKCSEIEGQEHEQLLKTFYEQWIYVFGPPERLVMDQQMSLMGHEAAAEFERLGISRCPRGTTAGHGSDQHTGTGIVERHVQLVKLTMYKLKAELQRQGMQPSRAELSQESAMAHNLTLCYGGVTPAMAVFGVLPREFYNPESDHVLNTSGAADTDLTVFERAMRIRQTSLAQAQQSIVEDRVARAARTRPHQLDVGTLVAGTSEVEFYREVKKDPGWRGPALLLRLDADEGVAIIQYQGKPYLVSLRHIRPFKVIYHLEIQTPQLEDSLRKLMHYVENMSEYKVYLYGWVRRRNEQWIKLPKNNHEATDVLAKAETVSKGLTKRSLHGVVFGRSLRPFKPPAGTTGILLTWMTGSRSYAMQEHQSDGHLQMKKVSALQKDELCLLYLFYYQNGLEESSTMDEKKGTSTTNGTKTSSPTTPMDEDPPDRKRPGPETRTVVLSPEKKRQRTNFVKKDLAFLEQWYTNVSNHQTIQLDFSDDWRYGCNLMTSTTRNFLLQRYDHSRQKMDFLFTVEYKTDHVVTACLRTARIYKVDTETTSGRSRL